jgi:hypothetical protein
MFENETQITQIKDLAEMIVLAEDRIARFERIVIAKKDELIALMQQAGQVGVKLESGLFPRLETKQRISKRKEIEAEQLYIWLVENGIGDIVRPTVHPKTLQSTLEGFIAAGNELPSEMFNQFEQTVIRFNGRTNFLTQETQKAQKYLATVGTENTEKKNLTTHN